MLKTSGNSYRDVLYRQLFNHIQNSLTYLKEASEPQEHLWDSEMAYRVDEIARKKGYRLSRRNTTVPELFIVGYEQDSMDKTISFLSGLGENSILQQCIFLAEGYDGEAAMLSKTNPVTNSKLNTIFSKYQIKPRGKDSFPLRERQYTNLGDRNLQHDEEKLLETIDCIVQRERDYFLPSFIEEKKQGKPILFLANMVHLASYLQTILNNHQLKYAFFVPRY